MTTQRTDELLILLQDAGLDFVVVGGVAAIAHGSARSTRDLDTVEMELLHGRSFRVISLDQLIAIKSALTRPKDKDVETELRAIRSLQGGADDETTAES